MDGRTCDRVTLCLLLSFSEPRGELRLKLCRPPESLFIVLLFLFFWIFRSVSRLEVGSKLFEKADDIAVVMITMRATKHTHTPSSHSSEFLLLLLLSWSRILEQSQIARSTLCHLMDGWMDGSSIHTNAHMHSLATQPTLAGSAH